MNHFQSLIEFEYPYNATAEQLANLRHVLSSPQVQPFPIIFDNEIFRAFFHTNDGRNIRISPSETPLPPKGWFNDVYSKYQNGSLKVVMPDDGRLHFHPHNECARRLFSDVADVRPSGVAYFSTRELSYNGHQVAWRLFECIVEVYGVGLDASHRDIDWVRVALEMGRPFEIDPNFARHLCKHYYNCIAPIVSLWLWEVDLVQARQNVIEHFENWPQVRLDYRRSPSNLKQAMDLFTGSIFTLNEMLDNPLPLSKLQGYFPAQCTPLAVERFVTKIAQTKELRRIVRHLPSYLAQVAIDIIQWVLHRLPSLGRKDVIKLLQDLVNESGMFLTQMEVDGFVQDGTTEIRAGEATVKFGHCQGQAVAVRVPNEERGAPTGASWMREKRYKRSVINHYQIDHNNVIRILGLLKGSTGMSIVMARMVGPLSEHVIPARYSRPNGSYGALARGIADGLAYLHDHHVTHGDLHWHNILLDKDDVPKIADLGMSRVVHVEGNSTSTGQYSSAMKVFMPYEVQDENKRREPTCRPAFSTDVYSFGVVLLCIALPEPGSAINSVLAKLTVIAESFVNPNITSTRQPMPDEFYDLPGGTHERYWRLIQDMTGWEIDRRPKINKVWKEIHSLFG